MQDLLKAIGEDIKEAYNTCEAYVNERLISKFWKASTWEGSLVQCAETFVKWRNKLTMALSAHAARGVDENTQRLKILQKRHALRYLSC